MTPIVWDFSNDLDYGERIHALGFNGITGIAFTVEATQTYNDEPVTDETDFVWSRGFECPPMVSGIVYVHFTVNCPAGLTLPAELSVRYGTLELEVDAAFIQTAGANVLQCVAWQFVGTGGNLVGSELELDLSDAGFAPSDLVNVGATVVFFDGVAQNELGVDYAQLSLNTYVEELTLDPSPSTGDYQIVITAAAQGRSDPDGVGIVSTSTERYTQIGVQQSSELSIGNLAFYFCDTSYNCACEVNPDTKTLAEIRHEMLVLTGYAAQAESPPPGIQAMYDAFARTSQDFLYSKYRPNNTKRFFSWTMTPSVRYYGLYDNRQCCSVKLDPNKIDGAWIQDLNNVWWPLIAGIDPVFYTLDQNFGWPAYYDVRQCIEVFPAPQAAYTLWIVGNFDLMPLTEDDDLTTINGSAVQNYGIFLAKAHKGMADAPIYRDMAMAKLGEYVAGSHKSRRYIPGTAELPIPTPPTMTHFESN